MRQTKYTVSPKKQLTEYMNYIKIIASIGLSYILLFLFIIDYPSISGIFTRFELEGFEKTLTKNSVLLAEMEVDEIRFITDNYSGNAAGKRALSLTVYGQSSLMDNKAYLYYENIKLNGIKAVLEDGKWVVYATKDTKQFKKQEIESLFEARLTSFIEAKKKLYDNQKAWTEKLKKKTVKKNVKL